MTKERPLVQVIITIVPIIPMFRMTIMKSSLITSEPLMIMLPLLPLTIIKKIEFVVTTKRAKVTLKRVPFDPHPKSQYDLVE
jgi:hypothetical protein